MARMTIPRVTRQKNGGTKGKNKKQQIRIQTRTRNLVRANTVSTVAAADLSSDSLRSLTLPSAL